MSIWYGWHRRDVDEKRDREWTGSYFDKQNRYSFQIHCWDTTKNFTAANATFFIFLCSIQVKSLLILGFKMDFIQMWIWFFFDFSRKKRKAGADWRRSLFFHYKKHSEFWSDVTLFLDWRMKLKKGLMRKMSNMRGGDDHRRIALILINMILKS